MPCKKLYLSDFDFEVPKQLIAQAPLQQKNSTRLLVYHHNREIEHSRISSFDQVIPANSLLLINDTRVMPCRLKGQLESGKAVEFLLLEKPLSSQNTSLALAIAKPSKALEIGSKIFFSQSLYAQVLKKTKLTYSYHFLLQFSCSQQNLLNWMDSYGYIPLPPYIQRKNPLVASQSEDTKLYQTVFAKGLGSSAAPTAGLHFTPEILKKLKKNNVTISPITLHVGAGTFSPVRQEEINNHQMHSENYLLPTKTLVAIEKAKKNKQKIIAVGTTTLRALESFYLHSQETGKCTTELSNTWLSTQLFIYPKTTDFSYKPQWIDALITNFHQPQSTLFMLICSLVGYEKTKSMYQEAVKNNYRFYSYGDSSCLWLDK